MISLLGDLLDVVVSDIDICKIAADYLVDWVKLSPQLGLKPPVVAEIRKSYNMDFGHQKQEALLKWKELKGHAATYRALIVAAEAIGNKLLADKVRKMEKNPDEGNET